MPPLHSLRLLVRILAGAILAAFTLCLAVVGLGYFGYGGPALHFVSVGMFDHFFGPKKTEPLRFTYQFTATERHYAFADEIDKKRIVITFAPEDKGLTVYKASRGLISPPSRSTAEDAFYISYSREGLTAEAFKAGKQFRAALHKCDFTLNQCNTLFEANRPISNPIDFSDGKIIFVGSDPEIRSCGMFARSDCIRYRNRDFYVRRPDGTIERLTNWKLIDLYSVSAANGLFVFQYPSQIKSKIYSSEFTLNGPVIGPPEPLFSYGKNFDAQPCVSPDGSKTAFLSSSESIGSRWRYDIVIVENTSYKMLYTVVPEIDAQLSPPVFIDANRIRFMSFDGQRYRFWELDVSTGNRNLLGEVTPEDIRRAKVYDFAKDAS